MQNVCCKTEDRLSKQNGKWGRETKEKERKSVSSKSDDTDGRLDGQHNKAC